MCMPLCITFYSADLEIWGTCAARWNALCWWRRIGQGQTWWRSLVMSATATFFKHGPWKTQMVIWVEHMVSDAPAMKNMSWENHRAPKTQPWKVDEGGWRWMKVDEAGKKKTAMIKEIAPNRRGLCRGTVLRSAFFVVNFWQWLRRCAAGNAHFPKARNTELVAGFNGKSPFLIGKPSINGPFSMDVYKKYKSQLGWWHSQFFWKVMKAMFQTTNRYEVCYFDLWLMGRPPIVHIPMFIHWFFDIRLQEFDGCNCVKTIAEASLNYTDMFRHQKKIDARIGAKERVSELKSSAFWPKLRGSDCSKKMSIDVVTGFLWVSMHWTTEN